MDTREQVRELLEAGVNVSDVARRLHMSRTGVYHHINKLKQLGQLPQVVKSRQVQRNALASYDEAINIQTELLNKQIELARTLPLAAIEAGARAHGYRLTPIDTNE